MYENVKSISEIQSLAKINHFTGVGSSDCLWMNTYTCTMYLHKADWCRSLKPEFDWSERKNNNSLLNLQRSSLGPCRRYLIQNTHVLKQHHDKKTVNVKVYKITKNRHTKTYNGQNYGKDGSTALERSATNVTGSSNLV